MVYASIVRCEAALCIGTRVNCLVARRSQDLVTWRYAISVLRHCAAVWRRHQVLCGRFRQAAEAKGEERDGVRGMSDVSP